MSRENLFMQAGEVWAECMKHEGKAPACFKMHPQAFDRIAHDSDGAVDPTTTARKLMGVPVLLDPQMPDGMIVAMTEQAMTNWQIQKGTSEIIETRLSDGEIEEMIRNEMGRRMASDVEKLMMGLDPAVPGADFTTEATVAADGEVLTIGKLKKAMDLMDLPVPPQHDGVEIDRGTWDELKELWKQYSYEPATGEIKRKEPAKPPRLLKDHPKKKRRNLDME